MTANELIRRIERGGGFIALTLDGEKLHVRVSCTEAELIKAQLQAIRPEIVAMLGQRTIVQLDVPCNCDEKPYPHFRHRDGTGPGSGRMLEPCNPEQAHRRQR